MAVDETVGTQIVDDAIDDLLPVGVERDVVHPRPRLTNLVGFKPTHLVRFERPRVFLEHLELPDRRVAEAHCAILLEERLAFVTDHDGGRVVVLPVILGELLVRHPDRIEHDQVALAPPNGSDGAALRAAVGFVDLEISETALAGTLDDLIPLYSVHAALLGVVAKGRNQRTDLLPLYPLQHGFVKWSRALKIRRFVLISAVVIVLPLGSHSLIPSYFL